MSTTVIWKAVTVTGGICHFRSETAAARWAGPQGSTEPVEFDTDETPSAATVEDLAMLVRRLSGALNAQSPNHPLTSLAMDYLERHQLAGSGLRHHPRPGSLERS